MTSIFDRLDAADVTWKNYFNNLPQAGLFVSATKGRFVPFETFFTDLASCVTPQTCQLPQVSFVDPAFFEVGVTGFEGTDEHPKNDIQEGQAFVASVVNALIASPVWKDSAMFLVYDEAGGFYDHVPPPAACAPDAFLPGNCADDPSGACTNLGQPSAQDLGGITVGFDRYGFRTPNAVISPWVKPAYVSHQVYDHTSVLKFLETRFQLPALTSRDANAGDMLDFFDFTQASPPLLTPPSLPLPAFDVEKGLQCVGTAAGT